MQADPTVPAVSGSFKPSTLQRLGLSQKTHLTQTSIEFLWTCNSPAFQLPCMRQSGVLEPPPSLQGSTQPCKMNQINQMTGFPGYRNPWWTPLGSVSPIHCSCSPSWLPQRSTKDLQSKLPADRFSTISMSLVFLSSFLPISPLLPFLVFIKQGLSSTVKVSFFPSVGNRLFN